MDRAHKSGASATPPVAPASPSIGYPSAGNAGTGTPPTEPGPYFYHMIIEELMNVITAAGIVPAQGTLTQLKSALDVLYAAKGYLLVRDEKAQNTAGGASVTTAMPTAQTRVLNTVVANTIAGASLASNQITLPAGTYRARASAPAMTNSHRAFLYNVTDSAYVAIGQNSNGSLVASADPIQTVSVVETRFVLATSKVIELRHYTSEAAANNGLGAFVNMGGVEVYSVVEIVKES